MRDTNENTLFGRFEDVLKCSLHTEPFSLEPLSTWLNGKQPTFADMFCGIGGFHSAADSLGMKCVFASDIDDAARDQYEHVYKLRPAGDICKIDADTIPDHDILCAGFPCQPFSIIGDRAGFADARGTLFFELARIIESKHPPAFVLENVKQLATHNKGRTLARILEILRGLGYWVDYRILNALNFGVPHKRERILIVGFYGDEITSFPWPTRRSPIIPLSELLEKKPDKSCFVSDRIRFARKQAHTSKHKPGIWHENKSGNISSHPFSCALRAGASYNYLLVDGERRLTPREMLRLQGFPDTFEIIGNDSAIRKQAGNSVPVPMVKAILERVINVQRTKAQRAIAAQKRPVSAGRTAAVPSHSHR
jgi:DNA (cytosine-5)-methyltransferase 1